MIINTWFKRLGPGILFAAAAIGVSHLVQATKAGAEYGMGLLWAVIIVHIFKYPFFQMGPRYAMATGESLLNGIFKLGRWLVVVYFILSLLSMFIIQAAVGLVTAGIAQYFFGFWDDVFSWLIIVTLTSALVLVIGKYKILDLLMKLVVILLTICTIVAVIIALNKNITTTTINFDQIFPNTVESIIFIIALMGWMPAPLDIIVWQSLWAIEKKKLENEYNTKQAIMDFNVGYGFTIILAICFLLLGALVMYGSGEQFSGNALQFSKQLVQLYSSQLGESTKMFIAVAALATMFSTSLTTLDGSSRIMSKATKLLFPHKEINDYFIWLSILVIGTFIIVKYFITSMGLMVKIATVFSFLAAPFYAILLLILMKSKHMPKKWQLGKGMTIYSIAGIVFLIGFSLLYIYSLIWL